MPRFQALREEDVQTKSSPSDLVTVADIEAEAWLTPRLMAALPHSQVIGEEAVSRGEAQVATIEGGQPVWVLDPVDGTYNFVHGNPAFCCMVGLVLNRQVLSGWIYFPTEEVLYWAGRGLGAWCGDTRVTLGQVGPEAAISRHLFATPRLKDRRREIMEALGPSRPTRCAGMDYRLAADGALACVAMARLTPWDHAPGTLLVTEAGGQVRLDAGPYDPRIEKGLLISGGDADRIHAIESFFGKE